MIPIGALAAYFQKEAPTPLEPVLEEQPVECPAWANQKPTNYLASL